MLLRLIAPLLVLLIAAGCAPRTEQAPTPAATSTPPAESSAPLSTPATALTNPPQPPPGVIPFQDCALTPGLAGCAAQPLPLLGRLALSDRAAGRVLVLDLSSGAGWQAAGYPGGLAWSPDGQSLLAWRDTDGGRQSELWQANGLPQTTPQDDRALAWQTDGALAPAGVLHSSDGAQYALAQDAGGGWLLQTRAPGVAERQVAIEAQHSDQLYLLLAVEPSSGKLLAKRFFATNLGLAAGGELLLIDPHSGALEALGQPAPPDGAPELAWNPEQPGLLAYAVTGAEPGLFTLALYDFASRTRSNPIPNGVQITSLDWHPGGKTLAFSAAPLPGLLSAAEAQQYPGAGIYTLDSGSGSVQLLHASPPNTQEIWLRWSAGADALLVGRQINRPEGLARLEVRVFVPAGGSDILLVAPLDLPGSPHAQPSAAGILAYTPR